MDVKDIEILLGVSHVDIKMVRGFMGYVNILLKHRGLCFKMEQNSTSIMYRNKPITETTYKYYLSYYQQHRYIYYTMILMYI